MNVDEIQFQKNEWRKKSWSIPDLPGGKQEYFSLVKQLVELVRLGQATDLDSFPVLTGIDIPKIWREYTPFLKGVGLVSNHAGILYLTDIGIDFCNDLTERNLANLMHNHFRLFGEILEILKIEPGTVQEIHSKLCNDYHLNWKNCSNTRRRLDWLEVLELIQPVGSRKWQVTKAGYSALSDWNIVTPNIISSFENVINDISVSTPPYEIAILLQQLAETPELHKKRSTYNIWTPSPNRINNLRVITQFALEKVSKTDLFQFIENEFNLKKSSAESMLPFLKASGLIEEVGRNIYITTSAAKAWCETGDDLDFIRILHAHMRFVGEMIKFAEIDIQRNTLYAKAKVYGLNNEKARWIIGFLLEAGVLEEPQYLHLRATHLGKCFIKNLPLAEEGIYEVKKEMHDTTTSFKKNVDTEIFEQLHSASVNPVAEGKAPGVAFEEAIANIFTFMGFEAKRVGGSGDTDVIVRWKDDGGKSIIAIVDGKSKSNGSVSHSDISDVAIDAHKEKNNADYVAIVGPGFSGDTIRNHAYKKGFALITDVELIEIARMSSTLGLSLQEIAFIFQIPDGLSKLDELIAARQREMDIITQVVSMFEKEQEMLGSLSARDMYLLLRNTEISPSLKELLNIFKTLSQDEIGILYPIKKDSSVENVTYMLKNEKRTINRLRALSSAIQKGLE